MAKKKYIETPEKMWQLPYKKNEDGNYIIVPKKRDYSGIDSVNKNKNPNGYIYFIRCEGTNFCKIGVSRNPKRRITDIDSYVPFNLEILSIHFMNNVYDIESNLKTAFIKHRVRREWYSFNNKQCADIMIDLHNQAVKQDGN
jgi:hypothetical protein